VKKFRNCLVDLDKTEFSRRLDRRGRCLLVVYNFLFAIFTWKIL